MSDGSEWLLWASRFNQLSLLPFLAFLWTLWHIPNAPTRAVHGFTFYLVFIAVGIPAGIYCRQQLGTSMANVDWIHGPCEALLTTANLLIVLGLRDALRGTPANNAGTQNDSSSSSGTADTQATQSNSDSSELACEATAQLQHQRPVSEPPLHPNPDEGLRAESPLKSSGPHSPGLATDSPKVASHHMLPPLDSHPPKRGPGILRVRSTRRVMSNAHRVRASCRGALSRAAVGNGQRHVSACRVVM